MNKSVLRYVPLLLVLPWLAACGTTSCDKPEPFQSAAEGGALKVPGDLSAPASSGKLDIPDAARGKQARGPCGDVPPMRKVASKADDAAATAAEAAAKELADAAQEAGAELPLPTTAVDPSTDVAEPVVAAVAGAVGANGPAQVTGRIESDVRETVIAWVKAWRAADGASLMNFYAADFEPPVPGEARSVWAENRVRLLAQTGPADVRYDLLKVRETFAGANARFIQEFHNQGRIDAVVKELDMIVEDERWKIVRERVVEVL